MGKDKRATSQSEISSNGQPRSNERAALAEAIALRDAAQAEDEALKQARARAASERFKAARAVEDAERALTSAREAARSTLVDAYVSGEDIDDRDVADAETALTAAQRRLADLQTVADALSSHRQAPGHSVPALKVTAAVRAIVRAHPTVRRLVQDFDTAKRTFETYHSTLRWLAACDCIPADLVEVAPKANETFFAEPANEWVSAIAALAIDADAGLPE